MTRAQNDIKRYIETQFAGGYQLTPIGDSVLELTDMTGETMRFACNVYGDIMDADTKQIIAESDLPHDLCRISTTARPQEWTTLPYRGRPAGRSR